MPRCYDCEGADPRTICAAQNVDECAQFTACPHDFNIYDCFKARREAEACDAHHDANDLPRPQTVFAASEEEGT